MQPISPNANSSQLSDTMALDTRARLLGVLHQQRSSQQHLGRKIHDDIGQYLTSISINAGLLARRIQQGKDKELITAINSASKMACRATRELTNQLQPKGVFCQNAIELDLTELAAYYDIDDAQPRLTVRNIETLDSTSLTLSLKICTLFEQFLLLFLADHQADAYALSLADSADQPDAPNNQLTVTARGLRLARQPADIEKQQLILQQNLKITDLTLETTTVGQFQQVRMQTCFQPEQGQREVRATAP